MQTNRALNQSDMIVIWGWDQTNIDRGLAGCH